MSQDHRSIVRRTDVPCSSSSPISTPLFTAVAYSSKDADALDDQYEGRSQGYTYAREGHPNASVLEAKLNWLENAKGGVLTSSGMSALGAIYLGLLKSGDHIVAGDQLYGRNLRLLNQDLPKFGITASLVDPTNAKDVEAAIRPETKMILVEVVSNPTLRIADMEGIAVLAKSKGIFLVVDNTFTTPAAYKPLDHGADITMHSVTKLLAGHSDVTLGYAASNDDAINQAMMDASVTWGLTPAPFDCWQAERGLHSFDLRFERAQETARALADCLAELDGVESVLYPGRQDHPDHNRANAILGDTPGNMVSFRLKGGRKEANAFIRGASHIPFAPTLGDIGTTLSHPASSSHRGLSEEQRQALGITQGFFRVSVGVENASQLLQEFSKALEGLKR